MLSGKQLQAVSVHALHYWPIILLLGFGLSLSYHVGYFVEPLGISFYHVSVEDLSKTGLPLSIALGSAQSILGIFTALNLSQSRWGKVAITVAVAFAFFSYDLYWYITGQQNEVGELESNIHFVQLWMKVSTFALTLLIVGVVYWPEKLANSDAFAFAYLLLGLIAFTSGQTHFFSDLRSSRSTQLVFSETETVIENYIAERSYFYLTLNADNCRFRVTQKSSLRTTEFIPDIHSNISARKAANCLSKL